MIVIVFIISIFSSNDLNYIQALEHTLVRQRLSIVITYSMNWIIEFFDKSVEAETFALHSKILAKMLHIFELIEMAGAQLGEPYTKSLNDGAA